MSLAEYQRKRDFSRTAEPGAAAAAKKRAGKLQYVIQKHDASRLHYDFRLELDGALKSWAVPKGIPFKQGDKRLAVEVEDHPLAYAKFEGIIPAGEYGGGSVMLWDRGAWENLGSDDALKDLAEGKLHFTLKGEKLEGEWALVRIRGSEERQWLLIKSGDDTAPVSKKRDDESVASGRTMQQIAAQASDVWESNRPGTAARTSLRDRIRARAHVAPEGPPAAAKKRSKPAGTMPAFIEPMKCKLVADPPRDGEWLYELKFDGYRALAIKRGDEVELLSRNRKDLGRKFPEVAQAVRALPVENAILDGEIVALDEGGGSSFQLLQAYEIGEERPPLRYYAFDLLHRDAADLRAAPLEQRRQALKDLLAGAPEPLHFSEEIVGDPREILALIKGRGIEGLICKRRGSAYEAGKRTGTWIKLKVVNQQEFVIGGYTPPKGTRDHFGALLVGYYEKETLRFAGKVGAGFTQESLQTLDQRFAKIRTDRCPFIDLPEKSGSRWSVAITGAEFRRCAWLKPELVCECRFAEWTRDGKLRHSVFLGLREDKRAAEVRREIAS